MIGVCVCVVRCLMRKAHGNLHQPWLAIRSDFFFIIFATFFFAIIFLFESTAMHMRSATVPAGCRRKKNENRSILEKNIAHHKHRPHYRHHHSFLFAQWTFQLSLGSHLQFINVLYVGPPIINFKRKKKLIGINYLIYARSMIKLCNKYTSLISQPFRSLLHFCFSAAASFILL